MKYKDSGLLLLRLTVGGLLMGHGAQKLFGVLGGHGMEGTEQFMDSLGLEPADKWARLAGWSEFGGGALTALGLWHPFGPLGIASAMTMAAITAHRGKPIWVSEGGAELPITNIGAVLALALAGPGRYSLDRALGIQLPRPVIGLATLVAAAGVYLGATQSREATAKPQEDRIELTQPAPEPADRESVFERDGATQPVPALG